MSDTTTKKAPSKKKAKSPPPRLGDEESASLRRGDGDIIPDDNEVSSDVDLDVKDDHDDTPKSTSKVAQQREDVARAKAEQEEKSREEIIEEAQRDLAALDPWTEEKGSRRWVIGQAPEHGGSEKDYAVFYQDKLEWMPRQRFFALVGQTMSKAIKATGGDVGGMADVFGDGEGSLIERGKRLVGKDFRDAASFFALAMELVAYSPNFLVDCYVIWLDVPKRDRGWARERFNEPWKPEQGKWGLTDEDHEEIIQTFLDQNYDNIRSFFAEKLPAMAKRVGLLERSKERKAILPGADDEDHANGSVS